MTIAKKYRNIILINATDAAASWRFFIFMEILNHVYIEGPVASNSSTDLEDSATIKMALTSLGYYDDTETGLAPYGDRQLFQAVKSFQKDNSLKVDGVIKPDGPTQSKIKTKLSENQTARNAFEIFKAHRKNMMDADTIGADKYTSAREACAIFRPKGLSEKY